VGEKVEWEGQEKYTPSYNVTPGKYQPIILPSKPDGTRILSSMRWGLRVKNFPHQPCNARSETVMTKYMFSRLLNSKRCVAICEGYYEWQTVIPGKQPFLIKPKNGPLFYFAALYDTYTDSNGEIVQTYTVITTPSSSSITPIHIRMPAILVGDEIDKWLSSKSIEEAVKLLKPYEGDLEIIPVSHAVGNSKNDYEDLVKEVDVKKETNSTPVPKLEKYFSVIHNNKKIKTENGPISINTLKNENYNDNKNNNNNDNKNNNIKIEEIEDDDNEANNQMEKKEQIMIEIESKDEKEEEERKNRNKKNKSYQLYRNDLNNNNLKEGNNNNNFEDDHFVFSISDEDIPFSPPCSPTKDDNNNNNNHNKNNNNEITNFFKPQSNYPTRPQEISLNNNKNNNKNKIKNNNNNPSPLKKEIKTKPKLITVTRAAQNPKKI